MKSSHLASFIILVTLLVAALFLTGCVPPPATSEGTQAVAEEETTRQIDRDKCDLYLNFAWSYYQNQNWVSAIKNFKKMMNYGCEEAYAKDIYSYFGRSYQQLAKNDPVYYDSALYVYQNGLQYLPNDVFIRKNIAYIYHVQGKIDQEIRQYEKMIEIEPDDLKLYRNYVKLCFAEKRYEDVLWGVEKILAIKPNDEQAINDRLTAYEKLGKDITQVRQEQWEQNPSNVRYGLDYAQILSEQLQYEKAIETLKAVTLLDLRNREAWEKLANMYTTLGKTKEAIEANIHIHKNIDSRDLEIIQDIATGYQQLSDFASAYEWAKKAVALGKSSLAYKIRADVFYSAAEYYTGSRQMNFEDRLVYKLAYDDYKKAYEMGDYSVKSRIDFLKEYLIPNKEHWFMNRYDASGATRNDFRPKLDCYSWVDIEASSD